LSLDHAWTGPRRTAGSSQSTSLVIARRRPPPVCDLSACRTDSQQKQIRRFRIWRAEYRELRSLRSGGSTICPTGSGGRSGCKGVVRSRLRNVCAAGIQSRQPILRVSPLRDRPSAVSADRYGVRGCLPKCLQPIYGLCSSERSEVVGPGSERRDRTQRRHF
jgi:hypothetical protein